MLLFFTPTIAFLCLTLSSVITILPWVKHMSQFTFVFLFYSLFFFTPYELQLYPYIPTVLLPVLVYFGGTARLDISGSHRTTAFSLVGTIPISPLSSPLVKSSSTLGSLDCLGLESHLIPPEIILSISAVPIKVIAKLQSHVARAFAYLVAKQRVLNQNTLIFTLTYPCYPFYHWLF